MKIDNEEVLNIARLAKIHLFDNEIGKFSRELSDLLESLEILKQIDTTGVPPTVRPGTLKNIIKEDKPRPSLSQEEVLANAPCREGEFFRVKAVLE